MDPSNPPSPFEDVREAFADLDTSEKAAFVFEATFETLGQALAETGRRVATVIDDLDIDSWFRSPVDADFAEPPPPPKPPRAPRAPKSKTAEPKSSRPKGTTKPPPGAPPPPDA